MVASQMPGARWQMVVVSGRIVVGNIWQCIVAWSNGFAFCYNTELCRGEFIWRLLRAFPSAVSFHAGKKLDELSERHFFTTANITCFINTIPSATCKKKLRLWLASAFIALRERFQDPTGALFRFAPALYIAGPRECGKSALIKLVIQPLFGGRMADPTNYLKDGKFNKDLFGAPLLIMDDKGASSNLAERRQRGEAIKSLIWTEEQRMEGKGADALILTPFRRLVIASNDDEAGLQICPALSPSLLDKLLILRARRAEKLPATHGDQDQWAKRIRAELPAFAYWLLQFKMPAGSCGISDRTRLPVFQHPSIVSALYDLQPEMRLLELIDLFDLLGSRPCWEGFATEFEQTMRSHDEKHLLDRIFISGTTAGKMLTELSRMSPELDLPVDAVAAKTVRRELINAIVERIPTGLGQGSDRAESYLPGWKRWEGWGNLTVTPVA